MGSSGWDSGQMTQDTHVLFTARPQYHSTIHASVSTLVFACFVLTCSVSRLFLVNLIMDLFCVTVE